MLGDFVRSVCFGIPEFRTRLAERKARSERGFVLVFSSLTLVVLTALGGFAVDVGNWYWSASRLQNAADAAALAGAGYLPGDPTSAIAAAQTSLRQNGFENVSVVTTPTKGGVDTKTPTVYIVQDPAHPTRLRVEVGRTVQNYFASLVGFYEQKLTRAANAFYRSPIEMGSPGNVLGFEPPDLDTVQSPDVTGPSSIVNADNSHYWLNIAGGKSNKIDGDKYTAGKCTTSKTDGCKSGVNDDITDKTPRAHYYRLHVPAGVSGPIRLQAFDGAFVDVGPMCAAKSYGYLGVDLTDPSLASAASSLGVPAAVYASGASDYCTGDTAASNPSYSGTPLAPKLTLKVYDVTGDADEVLTTQVPGTTTATYPAVTVNDAASLSTQLLSNPSASHSLAKSFRQWDTFAELTPNLGSGHDYIIEATTPDSAFGNNHFALRAGIWTGSNWNTMIGKKLSLSAKGHIAVFTNATAANASFYFAKMTSSQAGRTIDVNLFDIGDALKPIDLKLLAPRGGNLTSGFANCDQYGPSKYTYLNHMPCSIKSAQMNSAAGVPGYNGRNVTLRITLPDNYVCNDDGTDKCWMGIQFITSDLSRDTTTWEVLDCGRPLRLIGDNEPDTIDSCPNLTSSGLDETINSTTTTTTIPPSTTSTTKKPTTTTSSTVPGPTTSTTKKPTTTTAKPPSTTIKPTTTTTTPKPSTTTTTLWTGGS